MKIINVPNTDKDISGLKKSIVSEKKEVVTHIRNFLRAYKETKVPATKPSILHEEESDDYSYSSDRILSNKSVNKDNNTNKRNKCCQMI